AKIEQPSQPEASAVLSADTRGLLIPNDRPGAESPDWVRTASRYRGGRPAHEATGASRQGHNKVSRQATEGRGAPEKGYKRVGHEASRVDRATPGDAGGGCSIECVEPRHPGRSLCGGRA